MFVLLAIIIFLIIYPIMLSQSLPFHMIKEKDRYIKTDTTFTPVAERILVWISIGTFIIYIIIAGYFTQYMDSLTIYLKLDMLILFIFYLIKISISFKNKRPVSLFINYSLHSNKNKIIVMVLFSIFILAILETMGIIGY